MKMKLRSIVWIGVVAMLGVWATLSDAVADANAMSDSERIAMTQRGLDWLAKRQSRDGHWSAAGARYPTAMTALSGMALLCEGSTTTQGRYAKSISKAVGYLVRQSQTNGLIGSPRRDDRYTYGHGFSMLFLSQVLGEEEDEARRHELIDVLTRAVIFTGRAQTKAGGWGYVSAKDGHGFDEGSTTITQVQGLRGCRNAGIKVPKKVIDDAVKYIRDCTTDDGGVQYSSKGGGGRPAITAASLACLFNAGEYDDEYVPKLMAYCKKHLGDVGRDNSGHWHYAQYYYSQVMYREAGDDWERYRKAVYKKIAADATDDKTKYAHWGQGHVGKVYTTAINLTILQLENGYVPIYQR